MKNVRLWYKKQGAAKYASHLDLVRCFSRAVRRAGIPICYTEGFNPKPY
ncbi:MAG: TIGR03936 family radical SAM-associated protein, partial [Acutalibacteraceae bacterium]